MAQDHFEIEPEPRSWSLLPHWDWVFMISLGWLLFELFAQPAIGVLVASLKAGWPEVMNALWLLRRDDNRSRARTCAIFCIAYGFFRISVMTLLLVLLTYFILTFVNGPGRGPVQANQTALKVAGWVIGISFLLTSLISLAGAVLAWVSHCRVWVGYGLRDCRAKDQWPPQPGGSNAAPTMINLAIVATVPFYGVISGLLILLPNRLLGGILFGAVLIGGAILLLKANDGVQNRLTAGAPMQCWGLPEMSGVLFVEADDFIDETDDSPDDVFEDDSEDSP